MLELGWGHAGEIRSGIEAGNDIDTFDERVVSKIKVADRSRNVIFTSSDPQDRLNDHPTGYGSPAEGPAAPAQPGAARLANYFRHAVAKQTFSYLQTAGGGHGMAATKCHRSNWKQIRRHLGGWWPHDPGTAHFRHRSGP